MPFYQKGRKLSSIISDSVGSILFNVFIVSSKELSHQEIVNFLLASEGLQNRKNSYINIFEINYIQAKNEPYILEIL